MSDTPATLPAASSPLRELAVAFDCLAAEKDPDELTRLAVAVTQAQPGVTGARLWRREGGRLVVWQHAGVLPPPDETVAEAALLPVRDSGSPAALSGPGSILRSGGEDQAVWAGALGCEESTDYILEARGSRPLSESTRARLDLVRRFVSVLLAASERERRSRLAVEELSGIVEATKRLNSTLDLGELINIILQIATRQTEADRGTVFLVDREQQEIWSVVGLGLEQQEIRLPATKGIAGWVARNGKTVNLADAYGDPRFENDVDRRLGYHTRTLLCLPIHNKDGEIVGVLQLLNKRVGPFSAADESFLGALSLHVALALENAQLHRERLAKQRLERDLALARSIQAGLLPERPPELEGFEIGVCHRASQMVGGDYYDFVPLDAETLLVVVADVEGKGVAAALVMANLQASLRTLVPHLPALDGLVAAINRMILTDTRAQKYLSLFACQLDPRHRSLTYVNAGHVPPAVVRAGGETVFLQEGGLPVGLFPDAVYRCGSISLEAGDIVVCCTDGITEASGSREEEYGRERLAHAVQRHRAAPAQQMVDAVLSDVEHFSSGGTHEDDRVLLILKVL